MVKKVFIFCQYVLYDLLVMPFRKRVYRAEITDEFSDRLRRFHIECFKSFCEVGDFLKYVSIMGCECLFLRCGYDVFRETPF